MHVWDTNLCFVKAKMYDREFKSFKYILNKELDRDFIFVLTFKYILTSSSFVELESVDEQVL